MKKASIKKIFIIFISLSFLFVVPIILRELGLEHIFLIKSALAQCPACFCGCNCPPVWNDDACGPAGGCAADEMHQARTCVPAGCGIETQCVPDWYTAPAWIDDACGPAGGCAADEMHQTRTCVPAGCGIETQCVPDWYTAPAWIDDACGPAGGCAADEMHQTRASHYHCLPETQCNSVCTLWVNGGCGAPAGCLPGERAQDRDCDHTELGCGPEHQCIADVTCQNESAYPNGCTNGVDDDGDGCVDDQDSDCGGFETDCSDGIDNDCDGHIDEDDPDCPAGQIISFKNPLEAGSIPEIIARIADWFFIIGVGLVTLMIIIGGIIFMTAGGDPYKITKAKMLLFWTAIGAAITILSKGVSGIIKYISGG